MRTQLLLITAVAILPHYALAQDATLINIPGVGGSGFDGYINAVYAMFISIAALLAVVKLIIAGVKYMFSDVVTQKSDAKRDIQGALLGLVVVLSAVLILTVINPNLTSFNLSGVTQIDRAPRAVISTDRFAAAQANCNSNPTCTFQTCSDETCDAEQAACTARGRFPQVISGYSSMACVGAGTESAVVRETISGNETVSEYLASSPYTAVVEIYMINERDQLTNEDLTPTQIKAREDGNTLADLCELNADGTRTGNTYEIVENAAKDTTVRGCFR